MDLQTAGNHGNTARGASIPAKPVRNMLLPLSTMCRPEEQDVNRAQEPSQTLHVENCEFFQKPPWMMHKWCPTSNQALRDHQSLHRRSQQPCPGTGRRPRTLQLRKRHSFLHIQPGHPQEHPVFVSRPGRAVEPHKLAASSSPHCSRLSTRASISLRFVVMSLLHSTKLMTCWSTWTPLPSGHREADPTHQRSWRAHQSRAPSSGVPHQTQPANP